MNDEKQSDSLAGHLRTLQPASADDLKALAFYRAGLGALKQTGAVQLARTKNESRRLWAVAATVLLASNLGAYTFGRMERSPTASATLAQSKVAPAETTSIDSMDASISDSPVSAISQLESASQEIANSKPDAPQALPMWTVLLGVSERLDAQAYIQMVNERTTPLRLSSQTTATQDESTEMMSHDFPEWEQIRYKSPVRSWLSM